MEKLILYVACMILGGAGAWFIANCGHKLRLLDNPNDRSSHHAAIPKGGGIGILAAFVFGSVVFSVPKSFWIPSTFLALISFYGDRHELSPKFRLPIQFTAALILLIPILFSNSSSVLCPLYPVECLCFFYSTGVSSVLCLFFLSIFIVGTANFYNFMDGINGIAGITGVVGFGLLASYVYRFGPNESLFTLPICISLACLGFLPFNILKAKVFMGDVGSILLGFVFAGMVVWLSKNLLDFICLAAFLFPFYVDELTTMIVRLKDRENLTKAHRRHLYQLFANEMKIEHWKVSAGYGLLQLIVGISVLLLKPIGLLVIFLILAAYFAGFLLLSFIVRKKLAYKMQKT